VSWSTYETEDSWFESPPGGLFKETILFLLLRSVLVKSIKINDENTLKNHTIFLHKLYELHSLYRHAVHYILYEIF
jgi:hypothetical protein